jgi:hypothetical protein
MKTLKLTFVGLFVLFFNLSKADSPLTSTDFWVAYKNVKEVTYVNENGLDGKALKFLCGKKGSSLNKMAAINSLGFAHKKTNALETYLLSKRKGLKPEVFDFLKTESEDVPVENEQTKLLTGDDLMCWAYTQAMDDYFNPNFALKAAFFAYFRDQENMSYATVLSLIAAQKAFDSDWCNVYRIPKEYIENKTYSNNQLSAEAVKIIMDYIGLYQQDCKE